MFAYIKGSVTETGADYAVVEAAGVGWLLNASSTTIKQLKIGSTEKLYTHFYMAQDIVSLYGFYDTQERDMFRRLISVTRVGPKLALAVLSHLSVSDVAAAIFTENTAVLSKVPGMGKKTAARVLLELKEKINSEDMLSSGIQGDMNNSDIRAEAVAALVALGYDGVSAGRAVTAAGECDTVETLITKALQELGRRSRA